MEQLYTKDQFWKLYETSPQELQDALWAEQTGENIYEICERNGVKNLHSEILHLCTAVLVGLVLPQEFEIELVKRLKIKKLSAQKIAREINRFVFYPVKTQLEQLHKVPGEKDEERIVMPTPRHSERLERKRPTEESPLEEDLASPEALDKEEPKGAKDQDPYRETLE